MKQPVPAVDDELRHDDNGDRVRRGDLSQVGAERVTEIAEGSLDDVERKPNAEALPVLTHPAGLVGIEREEDAADVLELERLCVGDRTERGTVDAGDEHPANRALCDRQLTRDERHVGDHDARLLEQAQLEPERGQPAGSLEE